jgi:hypothetical protein
MIAKRINIRSKKLLSIFKTRISGVVKKHAQKRKEKTMNARHYHQMPEEAAGHALFHANLQRIT